MPMRLENKSAVIYGGSGFLGYGVTCAAIEAFSRILAGELAPSGIRVICLRPHAIPQASAMGSHRRKVFRPVAERGGMTVEEMLAGAGGGTLAPDACRGREHGGLHGVGPSQRDDGHRGQPDLRLPRRLDAIRRRR